ncbi:leucine-rich repeat receptor-like tyrosine-protein kinase PXC3 isoform X2 [Ricinus communis]|uniref:leucine-rich repeat receptor-like tyrosine-protein kinase PXC3 isoform X2 n=1 Tax=Ricinus communis TaxID=3988 RepID=UPI0007726873|nr:leucine-rich repeat receptor-like tyrosine-protein kinase PXC3 isoform X2 [Ricinus communis]|eukprot:XP_015579434.1 leucine-rich repeat receptor-like tyrosine-protein kinase PXC3 isoform X2 [Ricinus communis]
MTRYACGNSCFFSFSISSLFLFLLFPFGFSLSTNQTNTMITLSKLLKNNTASSPWDATSQPNPCLWKGVTCSLDGTSVTSLSLYGFGVSSSGFLINVCKIESLQSLDLSNNRFSSIPSEFISSCGGINGLKRLNFSRNGLTGVLPTFDGFVGLESLDLSFNSLSGRVDLQLDGLSALKSLNLSFNKFTGSVPVNLGKSMMLEEFMLSENFFQGEIPQEIFSYKNLSMIDLGANNLFGSIPNSIGNFTKLQLLILSANNLSGEIPPSIANIPTLSRFAANQNGFFGRIPSGITRYLSYLDLSYNKLNGSLPSDLLSQSNLLTVDLSYNTLDGLIPENISQSLVRLRLGSNLLHGQIPRSFPSLQLTYLELDNNSLNGVIPAELGSLQSLALLNLAQNNLNGSLPVQLGNISKLQVLKLQLNKFDGEIPPSISQLHKLSTLNISWNSLTGPIPFSISNLQDLAHLNLQGNKLNGSLPDNINSMSSLLELQLGENQLGGRIPMMPTKLQIALNLSSNLFQGPIPNTLSQLKDLEILDLSNNKFSEFQTWVALNASGNAGLINATKPNTSAELGEKRNSAAVAVILSVVSAVLAVGVVAIVALTFSRRFPKVNDQPSQSGEDLPAPQVIQGNLLTANTIHRSNINFSKAMEAVADPRNIVLKTRFSTYYKATMPSGASYFVKKLNWSDKLFQLGNHDKFDQELKVLGKLSNSNVMTPLAYVLTVDSAYLFYEHAQKGTLLDVLHGKLGHALDWASRYSIAVGVAQGLTFLHGYTSGPILLLDLSSRNILLKSLKEPLVGDIELYKLIDPTKSTGSFSTVAGSVGYIPPEYAYTMRVTMAGNVYSFGVVLLELLTGKPAVSEGTELAKWVLSKSSQQDRWDHILDFNISRTSLAVRGQMLAILKIALSCVSLSPEARPKMKSVLRMILNAR